MRALPVVAPVVVVLACLVGCSQESPAPGPGASSPSGTQSPSSASQSPAGSAGNRPPMVTSARLVSNALTRNDTVSPEFAAEDPDGDRVMMRYQWLANGSPVEGQTSATLALSALRRGDRASLELTPVDAKGLAGPAYQTGAVEVANTPPVVTRVTVEPAVAKPGDALRAAVEGSDVDGDPIKYAYEWWRNGQSTGAPSKDKDQEQRTLATEGFVRGDMIVVGVTPYDAGGPGRFLVSEPILLLNRPPLITSSPTAPTAQGSFEYVMAATDPDGDPLTYKLETAPSGMTIEAGTGRISWQMGASLTSPQQVRVGVDDGHQGQAFQEFTLMPPPAAR